MSTTTKSRKATTAKRAATAQRAAAAQQPDESAEPLSDQLAQDATPRRKPAGAPALWPFQQLPRRTRAEFLRAFGKVRKSTEALDLDHADDVDDDAEDVEVDDLERAAASYEMLAELEDAMRIAARDKDAFDDWARKASDNDLTALSNWYMDRFQVGEA